MPEDIYKEIVARLREIREGYFIKGIKLSASQFAQLVGQTVDKISNYERGISSVPSSLLIELYKNGINPTYVLTGEGSKFADNEKGRELEKHFGDRKQSTNLNNLVKFNSSGYTDEDLLKLIDAAAGDIRKRLESRSQSTRKSKGRNS